MDGKQHLYNENVINDDFEDSTGSSLSSCSSDSMEDVSSSSSSNGPLYELSELMAQLPIKRGLSKYYHGKSQTFSSLASVKSLEDLLKKDKPSRRAMKLCKSYGGGLDRHVFSPKAIISKKKNSGISLLSNLKFSTNGKVVNSLGSPKTSVWIKSPEA